MIGLNHVVLYMVIEHHGWCPPPTGRGLWNPLVNVSFVVNTCNYLNGWERGIDSIAWGNCCFEYQYWLVELVLMGWMCDKLIERRRYRSNFPLVPTTSKKRQNFEGNMGYIVLGGWLVWDHGERWVISILWKGRGHWFMQGRSHSHTRRGISKENKLSKKHIGSLEEST